MVLIPVAGIRHDHEIDPESGRVKAVTDVSITASDDSSVTVQFTEVDDGLGGVVGYEVYVREKGNTDFILQAEAAGATVGATKSIKAELLDPGKTYEVMVKAILAVAIRSFQSNVVEQATSSSSPAQPTGLSTTSVALGQVDLSWTDNGGTGFSIERRTPPGDPQEPLAGGVWAEIATVGDNVTTYNDVFAFVVDTSYEWRVFATDAGPTKSAPSNTISATIVEEEPTAPEVVSISLQTAFEFAFDIDGVAAPDDGRSSGPPPARSAGALAAAERSGSSSSIGSATSVAIAFEGGRRALSASTSESDSPASSGAADFPGDCAASACVEGSALEDSERLVGTGRMARGRRPSSSSIRLSR